VATSDRLTTQLAKLQEELDEANRAREAEAKKSERWREDSEREKRSGAELQQTLSEAEAKAYLLAASPAPATHILYPPTGQVQRLEGEVALAADCAKCASLQKASPPPPARSAPHPRPDMAGHPQSRNQLTAALTHT
jgi:hypothetical protein